MGKNRLFETYRTKFRGTMKHRMIDVFTADVDAFSREGLNKLDRRSMALDSLLHLLTLLGVKISIG